MADNERLCFIRWRTPESDSVELIDEISNRIIELRNRRKEFMENDTPEFLVPSINGEISELLQALRIDGDEDPFEKYKNDEVYSQNVRDEFADILIFLFDVMNLLELDISKEITKSLDLEISTNKDTTFKVLKDAIKKSNKYEEFKTPLNLAIEIGASSSRLFRPIGKLAGQLKGTDEEVAKAILEDEELYKKLTGILVEVFSQLLVFANMLDIDISKSIDQKLVKVEQKYPEDQ